MFIEGHSKEANASLLNSISSKGECEGLNVGIEELNFERVVGNRTDLPHELIKTLLGDGALSLRVDIHAVTVARGLSVDGYAKAHRFAIGGRPEDQMQVARV